MALTCNAMWVEWKQHIAKFPSIYHNPGTPNALYVHTPLISPSEFTPQIGLMFVVKAAVAGSFNADRIVVTLSFDSPILLDELVFRDRIGGYGLCLTR